MAGAGAALGEARAADESYGSKAECPLNRLFRERREGATAEVVAALVVAVAVVEAAAVVVSAAAVADLPAPEREGRAGDGTRAPVEALRLRRRVSM